MATLAPVEQSEASGTVSGTDTDLTLCGICLAPIENPKALPCLHTFCLGCIEEWTKGKTDTVKCPVCKEDFPLPTDGVSGFRNNFFVARLREKRALKDEVGKSRITCTFCNESENTAVAWCTDCKQNLCTNCVKCHKTLRLLEAHSVYSFDDVKSGKVDVQKTNTTEYCIKHKGQVLWFFCETCGVLICRDCTVVDHPAAKHTLVNVEDISGAQGKKMEELSSRCKKVAKQVADAIKVANDVENNLAVALQKATVDIGQITTKVKDTFLLNLKQSEQELINEMTKIGDQHKSQIKIEKDALMSQKSQLKRALDMTAHVTENGSPYDVAAMYTPLTDTLQRLGDIKPVIVPSTLSEVRVEANTDNRIDVPRLATVHAVTVEKVRDEIDNYRGEWEVEKEFGKEANLQFGTAIAVYPTGDVGVADWNAASVKVLNSCGQFKHNINVKTDSQNVYPRRVAISSDGTTYVTDWSRYVNVFDTNGKFVNKFEVKAPPTCTGKEAKLSGMAIDGNNKLIVGEYNSKYVSIHKLFGDHINSFKVAISPFSISAAPENTILITDYSRAQLLTHTGQVLYTLDSAPIQGVAWRPAGAHFSKSEFLMASENYSGKPGGIYHYSTNGEYLGQIAKEVTDPVGVTTTRDGKLLVLKRKCVLVLKKK